MLGVIFEYIYIYTYIHYIVYIAHGCLHKLVEIACYRFEGEN